MTHTLVPKEPTEAQWGGLARDLVMWCRFDKPTGAAFYSYLRSIDVEAPDWLLKEIPNTDRVPPKSTVAACIYKAMLATAPEPDDAGELERLKAEVEKLRAAMQPPPSPFSIPFSVCYRDDWTEEAYIEAIEALDASRKQLLSEARGEYQPGCSVCSDSGHTASSCHHNPLILARRWAMATHIHTCCHCGFIATTEDEDREHFGKSEDEVAACLTKRADDAVKALVEAAKAALDEGLVYWEPNTRKGRINREHIVSALRAALRPFLKGGE